VRQQDESDYRAYVEARSHALRRTAFLLCGDWHQAEDLVQTALLALYRSWHKVRDRDGLDAYVRTTLVRRTVDESRRPWRRESATAELPEVPLPEDQGLEDRELVLGVLRRLPPRQRAVVVLRFYDDLDVATTAALLGCSEGTVKSYTARAVITLRALLGPQLLATTHDGGTP